MRDNNLDNSFYDRADEHISLSNAQLKDCDPGKVSASMMYATARFNTWLTAQGFNDGNEMRTFNKKNIQYFVAEYKKMLEQNMEEYAKNFEEYLQQTSKSS